MSASVDAVAGSFFDGETLRLQGGSTADAMRIELDQDGSHIRGVVNDRAGEWQNMAFVRRIRIDGGEHVDTISIDSRISGRLDMVEIDQSVEQILMRPVVQAVDLFRESLSVGAEHPMDQFYDLEGLALGLVGVGSDDERALSLLTAASVVRARYDFRAEPYWQALLDEARAICRDRITAGRLRAAESTGERMSLAQAISYALTAQPLAEDDGLISARERHVATLVAEGLTNRQIGQRLGISPHTVARHVTHARSKLGLRSRAQLAVWAGRHTP